jgi:hypothetical protein
LLFTPTAFDYSDDYKKTMIEVASHVLCKGYPKEIKTHLDSRRIMMKKVSYLTDENTMNEIFQDLAFHYFNGYNKEYNVIPYFADYIQLFEKLKFDSTKIKQNITQLIESNLNNNPDLLDMLLLITKNRNNDVSQFKTALSMITPFIKDFDKLSNFSFGCYTKLLKIDKYNKNCINNSYTGSLKQRLDSRSIDTYQLASLYTTIQFSRVLSPSMSSTIKEYAKETIENFNANLSSVSNESFHGLMLFAIKHGSVNSEILKRFYAKSNKASRKYMSTMVKLGIYYASKNSFDDQEFWAKFIEVLSDSYNLYQLNSILAKELMEVCYILKEKDILDASSLIDKNVWSKLQDNCEHITKAKNYTTKGHMFIDIIEEKLKKEGVTDIYKFSRDYWFLPLVVPSLKTIYIIISRERNYCMRIARILKGKGWKIAVLSVKQNDSLQYKLDDLFDKPRTESSS